MSLIALAVFAAMPAHAGVSEARLGLMAHDIGVFGAQKEDGGDGNIELLFDSPRWLDVVWAPRPHAGVTLSFAGDTSQAYAGLSWSWRPFRAWFVEFSLGGAVHDGKLSSRERNRKELGSRVLFRESLSIGINIDERNSLMITLDHISNANLASNNEGLDTLGLRWGYRF